MLHFLMKNSNTKTTTVRIPVLLDDLIKKRIDSHEFSTKADFVLAAMRHTVYTYAVKKKELVEKFPEIPLTAERVNQLYETLTTTYLNGYRTFGSSAIQINVRVPIGFVDTIGPLLKVQYGFRKKADFVKVSIMCYVAAIDEVDQIFKDTEQLVAEQAKHLNDLYAMVARDIANQKPGQEIIKNCLDSILKKQ